MYKFNDKSLARYWYKQKQTPLKPRPRLHLYALLSHQTLSVIAPIFLKSVVLEAPGWDVLWSFELMCEILIVPIFVRVFYILSIRNLDLQSGVYRIK